MVLRALGEPFLRLLCGQQNVWSGERILTCPLYPGVTHFSASSCLWDLLLSLVSSSRKQDCSEAIVSGSCHPGLLQPKNPVTFLSEVFSLCLSLLGHVEGFFAGLEADTGSSCSIGLTAPSLCHWPPFSVSPLSFSAAALGSDPGLPVACLLVVQTGNIAGVSRILTP